MNRHLKQTVESLRLLPGSYIDCGFAQGQDALTRLREQVQYYRFSGSVDLLAVSMRETIHRLREWVSPCELPNDYVEFLEHYAGMAIHQNGIRLSVFGIGQFAETWYPPIWGDGWFLEPGKYGFLSLAFLHFRRHVEDDFQHVDFFMDIAGKVRKHSVIAVGPWPKVEFAHSFEVVMNTDAHAESWQRLANSFIGFLDLLAETKGSFGYL